MQAYNDTPLPAQVTVPNVTPGPTSGFFYNNVLYWRADVNKNINTQNGGISSDADFGSDLVDPKTLTGVHYATPTV